MGQEKKIKQDRNLTEINAAIIRGENYSAIARKYGYTPQAISNYARMQMSELMAKAEKMKSWTADRIVDEIEAVMSSAKKMLAAAEEYLRDPADPNKYTLHPNADEIWVTYIDGEDDNGRPIRRKDSLQGLLSSLREGGKPAVDIKIQQADPRKYLLESVDKISEQIERIARVRGEIQDVKINIQSNPVWIELQQVIIEGLADYPEARESIAQRLRAIEGDK